MDEKEIFGKFPAWYVKNHVWKMLKPNDVFLLGVLVVRANNITHICSPTWETLSRESGVSFSSIGKAMTRLETLGLIKRWRNGNRVRYHINFQPPEWAVNTTDWTEAGSISPKNPESYSRNPSTGQFLPRNSKTKTPSVTEHQVSENTESA